MLDFLLKPFKNKSPVINADLLKLKADQRVGFVVYAKQTISLDSFRETVCDELTIISGKHNNYPTRDFPIKTIFVNEKDNLNRIVDLAIRSCNTDIIVTLAADALKQNSKQINRALVEVLNMQYGMVVLDRSADGNESPEKVLRRFSGFDRVFRKQDYLDAHIDGNNNIMPKLNTFFAQKKFSVRSLLCNNLFSLDPLAGDRKEFNRGIKEFYSVYQKYKARSFLYESDDLNGRLIELSQIVKNYGATNLFYWLILASSVATSFIPIAYLGFKRLSKQAKSKPTKTKK
jgi:hypothetical protein